MEHIVGFITIMVLFAVYLLPSVVASSRHHRNSNAILVANLFLGWTLLGWVICLIWASTANVEGDNERAAETIRAGQHGRTV